MAGWDLLFVALAGVHAAAVLAFPSAPLIAAGVWWNSNTIAHNFIHRRFFRSRSLNALFSIGQSVLMGIPQTLWRDRHLAHHAGLEWRMRWSALFIAESSGVLALWSVLAFTLPQFFATIYVPGYLGGLALCAVQGYYEHAGATTSHYGRLYNVLCFNDGYHVEHHAFPGVHWRALPARTIAGARRSRWPALLRWIESGPRSLALDALERLVLGSPRLQRFVVDVHRTAFRALLADLPPPRRVAIVGGGLFPRTAIVLRELVPAAELVVIDASRRNVDIARRLVGGNIAFEHACFSADDPSVRFDLIVIPLAFRGDRTAIYRRPPARTVIVHDWLWRRRGRGRRVSLALLKRLNLVQA